MLKDLLKGVLSVIAVKVLDNYRRLSVQLLRIEAAKSYLNGVKLARQSALGVMTMGLIIALIVVGLLLFHACLFILLPWTLESKAIGGLFLGLAYMVGGGVALFKAMSEKTWMKKSGAARMIEEATGQSGT